MTAPATSPALARGALFGRYIILSLLGQGGMGEVYSAYDPRLDRKVALKILRQTDAGGAARTAQERLVREAQATARLSHRNIVVVYDTGTIEDEGAARVYLAMELVDGRTLAAWVGEKPRSWRSIRDVFLAAAEGLAAAHEAGLVHRDFKPQNVMVGADESARVLDFGLAADGADLENGAPALDRRSSDAVTAQTIALTHTGVLLGTPIYMAPEQFLGRKTDARTDQFSFCVALYEALHGERPFPCGSLSELVGAVVTGRMREPATRSRVPSFLRPILLRGMSPDPAARFPSMRDLMAALRADPLGRRSRVAFGAATAVLLLAGAAGARHAATRGQRLCGGAPAKLQGIWDLEAGGARRADLHRAFLATGSHIAEDTWTRASALLDDYVRKWTAAYTDTCEATHVRGDQSPEVMDLRMTCLDRRRDAFRALADIFAKADTRAVMEAVNAARALPAIEDCADVAALRAVVPAPAAPDARARLAELNAQLAQIKALTNTGHWPEANEKARALVDAARALGYQPVLAEALALHGWLAFRLGDLAAVIKADSEAVNVALAAQRDDLAAQQATEMLGISAFRGDLAAVDDWNKLAGALVRRLGPGHERITAWLHQSRAVASARQGDLQETMADLNVALSLKRRFLAPTDPDVAIALSDVAYLRALTGHAAQGLASAQEAIAIYRRAYGADSPAQWSALNNRGVVLRALHRYQEAEDDLRLALDFVTAWAGSGSVWTAQPLGELGRTLVEEGRYREAAPILDAAVRIWERGDLGSPDFAEVRFALAQARWELGQDRRGARLLAQAALDAYRPLPGYKPRADAITRWLSDKAAR